MATHTIVPKDSLNPDDIREDPPGSGNYLVEADYSIDLNVAPFSSGDSFVIQGSVGDNISFENSGGSKSVNIEFDGNSSAGGFQVEVRDGVDANVLLSSGTDISDVNFTMDYAGDVTLIGGPNVEIGNYSGSNTGDDTLFLGSGATVNGNIDTQSGGFADVTLGTGSTVTGTITAGDDGSDIKVGDGSNIGGDVTAGNGNNQIDLGDTDVGGKITTGDGRDDLTVGGTVQGNISTGRGEDELTFEDGARLMGSVDASYDDDEIIAGDGVRFMNTVDLGSGDDTLTAGDNVVFNNSYLKLGDGNDTVEVGDDAIFLSTIQGGQGNDSVTIGDGASIFDGIDLGYDNDTLIIGEDAEISGGEIMLGNGNSTVVIGDGYDLNGNKLTSGDGRDNIDLGDVSSSNSHALDLDTGKGSDTIRIGEIDPNRDNSIVAGTNNDAADTLYLEVADPGDRASLASALQAAGYTQSGNMWTAPGIDPGSGASSADVTWGNTTIENAEYIHMVCFTRGTRIATVRGEVAIEDLVEGDMVQTLDHGLQPIRWVGSTKVKAQGRMAPVRIAAGALGNTRDLLVSPQHRMMLAGWQMELMFAEPEVLAPAISLINDSTIRRQTGGEVEYFHMLFDEHEIVFAEGAPSESFHPGRQGLGALAEATREEIFTLFPELRDDADCYGPAARMSLKAYEAEVAIDVLLSERADDGTEMTYAAVA